MRTLEEELYSAVETVVTVRGETAPVMAAMREMAAKADVGHEQVKESMGERRAEMDTWGMAVVGALWALTADRRIHVGRSIHDSCTI